MKLRNIALSVGLMCALAGPQLALAQNPEKDNAFAMQLAKDCDIGKTGMVTKANYMKMMEAKWDRMAKGATELSVANTAKIFMDSTQSSN